MENCNTIHVLNMIKNEFLVAGRILNVVAFYSDPFKCSDRCVRVLAINTLVYKLLWGKFPPT